MKCANILSCVLLVASVLQAEEADLNSPSLGAAFIPADAWRDVMKAKDLKLKLPTARGAAVIYVLKNGALDRAGLGSLDVITHIDGEAVTDTATFSRKISSLPLGKPVKVVAYHARKSRTGIAWDKKSVEVTPLSRGETALAAMKSSEDDVLDVTSFKHVDDPNTPGPTGVIIRFFKRGDVIATPSVRFQLARQEYFGVRSIIVRAGERLVTVNIPGLAKSEIDGGVWEWHDVPLDSSRGDLRSILEGDDDITVRFVSSEFTHDHKIDVDERERIRMTFTAFRAMGGK